MLTHVRSIGRGWEAAPFLMVLISLAVPAHAAAEGEVTIPMSPALRFDASINPSHPSAGRPVPVALTVKGRVVREGFTGAPPGISGLALRFDRNLTVDLGPRSGCDARCSRTTVGWGDFLVFAELGGGRTVKARAKILAGGRGRPALLELVVPAPIEETFTVPIRTGVVTGSTRFGSELKFALPPIDGGRATLHSFALTLGRGPVPPTTSPVASVRCGSGEYRILAKATATNGEKMQTTAVRPC